MSALDLFKINLLSPLVLAFLLGLLAKAVRSELSLPRDIYAGISLYLLLALGLKGGVELSQTTFHEIAMPALATLILGVVTPLSAYVAFRQLGRFGGIDAAAIAAHYGSVSAVTFIAATQFVGALGQKVEGYLPTLLTLLESPGIHIALAVGVLQRTKKNVGSVKASGSVFHEIFTSRSMVLLVGGLAIGFISGEKNYEPIKPFFETGFKGALVLFLLEMGLVAGERLKDVARVGLRLVSLGVLVPIVHGALGVLLGHAAGLSLGGATVLGAMAASASYIAAPPAVRMTLPEANPAYSLTASLVITFPFNLLVGIPLYYSLAVWLAKGGV